MRPPAEDWHTSEREPNPDRRAASKQRPQSGGGLLHQAGQWLKSKAGEYDEPPDDRRDEPPPVLPAAPRRTSTIGSSERPRAAHALLRRPRARTADRHSHPHALTNVRDSATISRSRIHGQRDTRAVRPRAHRRTSLRPAQPLGRRPAQRSRRHPLPEDPQLGRVRRLAPRPHGRSRGRRSAAPQRQPVDDLGAGGEPALRAGHRHRFTREPACGAAGPAGAACGPPASGDLVGRQRGRYPGALVLVEDVDPALVAGRRENGVATNAAAISAASSGCACGPRWPTTWASLCWRVRVAVSMFQASAARMPGTLFAAICSPLPEPPMTTPRLPGSASTRRAPRCRTAGSRPRRRSGRGRRRRLVARLARCATRWALSSKPAWSEPR